MKEEELKVAASLLHEWWPSVGFLGGNILGSIVV